MARKHLTETPHEVTIRRERPAREAAFEFSEEVVESFDDAGNRVDGCCHGLGKNRLRDHERF